MYFPLTAAISSYFTNRLLENENKDDKINELKTELESIHDENAELKREIVELKKLIKNK